MTQHLTPYEVVHALIGPPDVTGPICGLGAKAPFAWRNGSKMRAGGDIPSAVQMRRLKKHSDEHQLGLTYAHLVEGAPKDEIDAILARREASGSDPVAAE